MKPGTPVIWKVHLLDWKAVPLWIYLGGSCLCIADLALVISWSLDEYLWIASYALSIKRWPVLSQQCTDRNHQDKSRQVQLFNLEGTPSKSHVTDSGQPAAASSRHSWSTHFAVQGASAKQWQWRQEVLELTTRINFSALLQKYIIPCESWDSCEQHFTFLECGAQSLLNSVFWTC